MSVKTTIPAEPIALAIGDTLAGEPLGPLTRTDFVRYAGAGGDLNPIHYDEPLAQSAGFPTVFGMGMLHAGVLGARVARWVGPDNLKSFSVRFAGQVWPGDVLTFTGTVEDVSDGVATIALAITRQSGEVVLTGEAKAAVR